MQLLGAGAGYNPLERMAYLLRLPPACVEIARRAQGQHRVVQHGTGSPWAHMALGHVHAGAEHKFLCDHVVDGRILMPATSYVVTAWEALCNMKTRKMEDTPVTFEDVQIRQAVTAEEGQKIALAVLIAPDNRFCVSSQPIVHENAFMMPFLHLHSWLPRLPLGFSSALTSDQLLVGGCSSSIARSAVSSSTTGFLASRSQAL